MYQRVTFYDSPPEAFSSLHTFLRKTKILKLPMAFAIICICIGTVLLSFGLVIIEKIWAKNTPYLKKIIMLSFTLHFRILNYTLHDTFFPPQIKCFLYPWLHIRQLASNCSSSCSVILSSRQREHF